MNGGPSVLVLGVGNTLMQDDGVGVLAVRALAETYELPPEVRVLDAGVIELTLLTELAGVERLLLIDAMQGGGEPGTIYRLTPDGLRPRAGPSLSAHETGLSEVLSVARLLGRLPQTRILGIQPKEAGLPGLELTPPLQGALPRVVSAAVEELRELGIAIREKHPALYELDAGV